MSQTKVQLIAPIGVVTASTLETTGVLTATTFVGDIAGTVTGITSTTDNLNLGIITATSFAGDFTGIGSGLTGTPNIVAGVVTATKFVGNTPGTVSGLADGTNINAGIITATSFVGNLTGNAAGLSTTTAQLTLGIVTATSYSGSGANLSGVSAGPVAQQAVTANSGTTTIDLSSGNVIYMTQSSNTTVSFANTEGNTDVVYLIRTKDDNTTARTITWPSGFAWDGGTEPTLLTNETENEAQIFKLTTRDNGATWYGVEVVNYSAYIAPARQLWSWGYDHYGQLGQNDRVFKSSPVQIPGTTWMNVQCGDTVAQSAFKTDNTLWVWGRNTSYGKLGQNNLTHYSSPVQLPGSWKTFSHYNSGGLGLKNDGTLWGTGDDAGTNNTVNYSSPVQITSATNWKMIAPAHNGGQRAAINTDSELYVWGGIGEGNGFTGDRVTYSSPIQIPGSWGSVRGGIYVITGVKTDGTLWMSGRNHGGVDGSLGQNNTTEYSSPVQVPGTNWAYGAGKVAGGDFGCMALRTDGTLWVWGRNGSGELGQNDTNYRSSPVQVPGTNWALIETGYLNNYAIKTDGTLWGWGDNRYGHLGQNSRTYFSSPVQIPGTYPTSVLTDGFAVISASYGTVSVLK
jgi:alpha-tubulin suppressor-like RCC1 family protein/uncharacterized protein YunC (DUF1805 family)